MAPYSFYDDPQCDICYRHFENENNLRAHKLIHLPKDIPCYARGCEKTFATDSALLIHLESGACEANNCDAAAINRLAARCYQWKKYVAPGCRDWMLNQTDPWPRTLCYQCPDLDCCVRFSTLSGLVQHVESQRCDEEIHNGTRSIGKLLHWIWLNV